MSSGCQDVVLTLPAGTRFGGAARSAAGELARRGGFSARQWAQLETAVERTLDLLHRQPGDRVRFTFGAHSQAISVEAERTSERSRPVADEAGGAPDGEVARFHSEVAGLVEGPEVDADGARIRFRTRRS